MGERICNHDNMPRLVVGQYRHALQSATGATGDATRTLHDAFFAALAHSLMEAGIKFKGGGRSIGSCKHIFSHIMHAFVGADETALRKLSGMSLCVFCIMLFVKFPLGGRYIWSGKGERWGVGRIKVL